MVCNRLAQKIINKILYPIHPYWSANMYGFGKWIRRYGFYPPVLPLCIFTDHGPGDSAGSPHSPELQSDAPVQFYHASSAVERWKRLSSKPCYPLYSPFVFARHAMGIEPANDAEGSVFFIAHSTIDCVDNKKVEAYHKELCELPGKYHPITICLHWHDVKIGVDKQYEALGYPVVTAGLAFDQQFPKNFYNILRHKKYALSNTFGSHALYAIEMGIPFGLYGAEPEYFAIDSGYLKKGRQTIYRESNYYVEAVKLFSHLPQEQISEEQREFAHKYLGLKDGLSRKKMAWVLYKSLFQWVILFIWVKFLVRLITRKWREIFATSKHEAE